MARHTSVSVEPLKGRPYDRDPTFWCFVRRSILWNRQTSVFSNEGSHEEFQDAFKNTSRTHSSTLFSVGNLGAQGLGLQVCGLRSLSPLFLTGMSSSILTAVPLLFVHLSSITAGAKATEP